MSRYLLLKDDQEIGPFTLEELKSMQVSPDDLVWIEGKSTIWTHVKDVRDLASLWSEASYTQRSSPDETCVPAAFPASIDYNFEQGTPFSRTENAETYPSASSEKAIKFLNRFSWVAVVAGIGLVGIFITKMVRKSKEMVVMPREASSSANLPNQHLDNTENFQNALTKEIILVPDTTKAAPPKKVKPKNLKSLVKIENNKYRVGLFGGINNLQLTVENNSDELLDKVTIQLDYLKPNGEVINSDTIYARMIRPQDSKLIEVPDTKRGVKINYKVISVKAHEFTVPISQA